MIALVVPWFAAAEESEDWLDRVRLSAAVGYEYDDNVSAPEIDSASEQGASAGVFEAGIEIEAYRGEVLELDLGYDFYQSLYAENDAADLDLRLHLPWFTLGRQWQDFDLDFTSRVSIADLGGDDYFQTYSLGPGAGRLLGDSVYASTRYTYQYRHFEVSHPLVTSTSDRSAHRHELRADLLWLITRFDGRVRGAFLYQVEDATENHVFDYDGLGFQTGADWRLPLPGIGFGSPELQFQIAYTARKYAGDSRALTGAGRRRDDRVNLLIGLELPIYHKLYGTIAFERLASDSNDPAADYNSNVVRLAISGRL